MGNAFQTTSDIGVGLPPGSFVADDEDAYVGFTQIQRGNPNEEEIAAITAVLLGLRLAMLQDALDHLQDNAWSSASKAEHIHQSPLISAADPRLNAKSNRTWFARR